MRVNAATSNACSVTEKTMPSHDRRIALAPGARETLPQKTTAAEHEFRPSRGAGLASAAIDGSMHEMKAGCFACTVAAQSPPEVEALLPRQPLTKRIFLALLLASGCTRSAAPSIDSLVAPFLGPDYGGVAVAVIRDGAVVVRRGFGPADRERSVPVTPATVFDLASLSKQFTGTALLLLAQRGQLAMDDDVRKYLPEVPTFDTVRPIRLVDLSRHRSGLAEYPRGDSVPTEADVLAWLAQQTTLKFPTDTRWDYVNLNYFVLARVVERVSGMTLREFLAKEVFAPADMRTAQVLERPDGEITGRAVGYCFGKPCRADDGLTGPGGVFASLDDMIAWDESLTRGAPFDFGAIVDAVGSGYAFGWRAVAHDGHRALEHDGDAIGTRTYLVRYLDRPLTVIILSNQTRFEVERLEQVLAGKY